MFFGGFFCGWWSTSCGTGGIYSQARLGSAADRHCTQPQEPATTFDAPLAPEANEITAGGMELTLSLTDLQIPAG